MSVQSAIYQALRALVADRVYPSAFPQGSPTPVWPAIRYTLISIDPAAALCGTVDEGGDDVRVQIDIVAETYAGMRSLRTQVVAALDGTDPPSSRMPGGFEAYDAETRTHRAVVEYRFYQSLNT